MQSGSSTFFGLVPLFVGAGIICCVGSGSLLPAVAVVIALFTVLKWCNVLDQHTIDDRKKGSSSTGRRHNQPYDGRRVLTVGEVEQRRRRRNRHRKGM